MEETKEIINETGTFACTDCGADLKFKPGTNHLTCEYCGTENEIPSVDAEIKELDFEAYLTNASAREEELTVSMVNCTSCGATSSLEPNMQSSTCPYCSAPLVVESVHDESVIQPKSLLPFKLNKEEARGEFKKWIKKLWFAPNDLKKATLNFDHFRGVYIPYWTYDSDTHSHYIGQRGEYYYVSESYTTQENGKTVTKTRQVRKTRWYNVSGYIDNAFDDVLTVATKSLPEKQIYKLEPWDLENLVPFSKDYLSGFITEKYQISLKDGFGIAKGIMEKTIRKMVRRDIGGDEQRIINVSTQYNSITFKHLLLPVFVSAYKFKNKLFRFLVNGRTGEVQGERPYSWIKITLAILALLAVIGAIVIISQHTGAA